ncbi:nudix hydrolase 26, chloroplastic-like isoform X1 [Olea europaea var. sylvestris]|uniref:nudix hydrolase 26, chloroplastic-like isoform X1 n=1 Tax=Olea europaea var. sylvestris TaxID=158386 RepID=UPI000C1D32F0|nr:nudix hydrolase 26, chloroplastic-like isoform X1 [Olea europaea var. sylvestris]
MARCFIQFHSPFSRSLLRRTSANTNILFFPYCPPKAHKFTPSLLHHKIPGVAFSSLSSLSSMENPPQGYRKNVGICLMNPSKKIFAASRLDIPDSWQMPQGGIDENEDPKSAAIRELREETGVSSAYIIAEVPHWLTYDFPPDVREKLRHQWGSDWKGQAQKWFLFKFTGNDEEINLLGDGTEKPEFGEWSWLSPEEIINLVVDFKKPVYQEVMTVFSPHLEQNIEKVDF